MLELSKYRNLVTSFRLMGVDKMYLLKMKNLLKNICLIMFLILLLGFNGYAQSIDLNKENRQTEFKISIPLDYPYFNLLDKPNFQDQEEKSSFLFLPKDLHYHQLGYFCKSELKLEQNTKFPIRFRLGEWSYVNRLEGKQ